MFGFKAGCKKDSFWTRRCRCAFKTVLVICSQRYRGIQFTRVPMKGILTELCYRCHCKIHNYKLSDETFIFLEIQQSIRDLLIDIYPTTTFSIWMDMPLQFEFILSLIFIWLYGVRHQYSIENFETVILTVRVLILANINSWSKIF